MKINDRVYGEEEINEKVLIDLINSDEVQRLKKISQQGLPEEYCREPTFSRYEHSLGVMILLKRLNANLDEQIAGLIHDVSHTAFSHVTELLFGDPRKDDYQDKKHQIFVENSEIPEILEKHGFNCKKIINLKNFSLLENEVPDLCADRFDYAIREIFMENEKDKIDYIIKSLINCGGRMAFSSYEAAKIFALSFLKCQVYHWGSDEARIRFKILAEILDYGLKKGIISNRDLWKDDEFVLSLLRGANDGKISRGFELLERGSVVDLEDYNKNLIKKFRYVDPLIIVEGDLFRLSDVLEDYKKLLEIEKEKSMSINSKKE